MANNFFCLDLGESYIKAVDAEKSGNLFEIKSIGFVPSITNFYSISTDKIIVDQAALISKLISTLKINKKNVNIIIPDSMTYSQIIEMPKLNEKELIAAIRYQADQFIPMPLEKVTLDLEVLAEDKVNHKVLVLIVASPQDFIDKVEKTAEAAGLICQSIENELTSTSRFVTDLLPLNPQGKAYIIVNFGLSSTDLYLYDQKQSQILQNHNFNIGYELFCKELKQNLNLDSNKAEQLLKEIGLAKNASYNLEEVLSPVLSSFVKQIEKFAVVSQEKFNLKLGMILLANESIRINEFDKKITTYLNVPCANLDFYENIKNNKTLDSLRPNLPLFVPAMGGNL